MTERLIYEHNLFSVAMRTEENRSIRFLVAPMISPNIDTLDAVWQYAARPIPENRNDFLITRSSADALYKVSDKFPQMVHDARRGPVVFPDTLGVPSKWSSSVSANARVKGPFPSPNCGPQLAELESLELHLVLAVQPAALRAGFDSDTMPMGIRAMAETIREIKPLVHSMRIISHPVMQKNERLSGVEWTNLILYLHHADKHPQDSAALTFLIKKLSTVFLRDTAFKLFASNQYFRTVLRLPSFGSTRVMKMHQTPFIEGVVEKSMISKDFMYIASIMEPCVATRENKKALRKTCVRMAHEIVHDAFIALTTDNQPEFWRLLPHRKSQQTLAANLHQSLTMRKTVDHKTLCFMYMDYLEKVIVAYIKSFAVRGIAPGVNKKKIIDDQLPAIICSYYIYEKGETPPIYDPIKTAKQRKGLQDYVGMCRNFLALLDQYLTRMHTTGERSSFKSFMKKFHPRT